MSGVPHRIQVATPFGPSAYVREDFVLAQLNKLWKTVFESEMLSSKELIEKLQEFEDKLK
jgi:hypothetical protein